ncbi:MAG: 50S ribosomal protein L22 [Bradymonadaceae bacterium]
MATNDELETRANTASAKHVRIAPRKARMVINLIREKPILDALDILQFTQKRAAPIIAKVVESALANVEDSDDLDWELDDLHVAEAYVNEGPTLKRFKPRAMGRATTILKKTSHINVALEPRDSD